MTPDGQQCLNMTLDKGHTTFFAKKQSRMLCLSMAMSPCLCFQPKGFVMVDTSMHGLVNTQTAADSADVTASKHGARNTLHPAQ